MILVSSPPPDPSSICAFPLLRSQLASFHSGRCSELPVKKVACGRRSALPRSPTFFGRDDNVLRDSLATSGQYLCSLVTSETATGRPSAASAVFAGSIPTLARVAHRITLRWGQTRQRLLYCSNRGYLRSTERRGCWRGSFSYLITTCRHKRSKPTRRFPRPWNAGRGT